MSILESLAQREQSDTDSAWKVYLSAVRCEAEGKDSTPPKIDKLREALAALGKTPADLTKDISILRSAFQAELLVATIQTIRSDYATHQKQLEDYDASTVELIESRQPQRTQLVAACDAGNRALRKAEDAESRLEKLRFEHWRVLGLSDPVNDARRAHLIQEMRDDKHPATKYRVINFGSLIESKYSHRIDDLEFIPLGKQTPSELDELLSITRQWQRNEIKQPAYLISVTDTFPLASVSTKFIVEFEPSKASIEHQGSDAIPYPDPHGYTFLLHPGQKREALDAMTKELITRFDAHPAVRNRQQKKEFYDGPMAGRGAMTDLGSNSIAKILQGAEASVRA
ncbi:MAG TPA: hypothetical protein VGG19_02965 [Tepidisphaeraceae bacterium]|jgi:hypothetical protein